MKPIVLPANTVGAAGMALAEPHAEATRAPAVDHDVLRRDALEAPSEARP